MFLCNYGFKCMILTFQIFLFIKGWKSSWEEKYIPWTNMAGEIYRYTN